ncbi:MAG: biopolymer transporter ExbD [Leptolyngbyaceae cyanobacterium RU_5_1]|nr:biopolymer transporter ExbD [Leptolyngbyaceae cyanobacterium RU_5_1]
MPEVNLIPLMDVVMTVLTFFIIATMSLTSLQVINAPLPSTETDKAKQAPPQPLIITLNWQEQLLMGDRVTNNTQLTQAVLAYLNQNPKGAVLLKADEQLPYETVVQQLGRLQDLGGDRVSLAIE